MKALENLLDGLKYQCIIGEPSRVMIQAVEFDSRVANTGSLFVAVKGFSQDGHDYLQSAYDEGCRCFIVDRKVDFQLDDICLVQVADSSEALALVAANYFDEPSKELKLIGITGTNGKTTCATLMYDLFCGLGYKTGLLSTVVNKIGKELVLATHTTPNPVALNAILRDMVNAGCSHCFMEVSSHAIDQNRTFGLCFEGGVFTNISHDHLDYHKTFSAYIKAKKQFFE